MGTISPSTQFLLVIPTAAIAVSYFLLLFLIKSPLCKFFCDSPGHRKVHQRVVPRIGGLAVITSFLLILWLWRFLFPHLFSLVDISVLRSILFATVCIATVGTIDDIHLLEINNKAKFLLEILIAFEIAVLYRIYFTEIGIAGHMFQLGWIGIPISVLWMVGITNASNIIDGVDSLASGVLAIGFIAVGVLAYNAGAFGVVYICMILVGVIIGFMFHNNSPARAFLGDTGSLFLGMILSILAVHVTRLPDSYSSFVVVLLVAGFPILDVFAAMTRRFVRAVRQGYSWPKALGRMGLPDNEHIHHRLIYRGMGHQQTSFLLHGIAATFCASAIIVSRVPALLGSLVIGYLCIMIFFILYRLNFYDSIFKMFRRVPLHHGSDALRRIKVAVVNTDEILRHALLSFKQASFAFSFVDSNAEPKCLEDCAVAIIVNQDETLFVNSFKQASEYAQKHKCFVVLISDVINGESVPNETHTLSRVTFYRRPVYIPILMEKLYTLARVPKSMREPFAQQPKEHHRVAAG